EQVTRKPDGLTRLIAWRLISRYPCSPSFNFVLLLIKAGGSRITQSYCTPVDACFLSSSNRSAFLKSHRSSNPFRRELALARPTAFSDPSRPVTRRAP